MTKSVTTAIRFFWQANRIPTLWRVPKHGMRVNPFPSTAQEFLDNGLENYDVIQVNPSNGTYGLLEIEEPDLWLLEKISEVHSELREEHLARACKPMREIASRFTTMAVGDSPCQYNPLSLRAWIDTCWILGEYLYVAVILKEEGLLAAINYIKSQISEESNGGVIWSELENTGILGKQNARLRDYPYPVWNNTHYLSICLSKSPNDFRKALSSYAMFLFNLDCKISIQDVYPAIQQGYDAGLPDGQYMRLWAHTGIRGMAAYFLANTLQRGHDVILCEGCGLPLIQTRGNRKTHGTLCRKKKQRKADSLELQSDRVQ